jgi:HD superfamily phosphohydrolase
MTSDRKYLLECNCQHKENLEILNEILGGVLDLDRLDIYARDTYFSGLKLVAFNLRSFLGSITIDITDGHPTFLTTTVGASYAINLLFSRRQIQSIIFRNPKTVAFQAMLNWALTTHIASGKQDDCIKIAMMEDDQLLDALLNSPSNSVCNVIRRIRSMKSYALVAKWPNEILGEDSQLIEHKRQRLKEYFQSLEVSEKGPAALVYEEHGFWPGADDGGREWLNPTRLLVVEERGRRVFLSEHIDYKSDVSHLARADLLKFLWVFVRDEDKKTEIEDTIEDILNPRLPVRQVVRR